MVKISSSGIKIVLTCITHNYMSYWTPQRSFRHPWGPHNGPKHHPNGPRGTWRARRVQIWSQLPPMGLTGLESWLPDTLTWYLAIYGLPGTPKGPVFAQNYPKCSFLDFFSQLESPMEVRFFSLAKCPSRANFDRSHDGSATNFNFGHFGAKKGH